MGYRFDEIEGIGPKYAERLGAAGIATTEALLGAVPIPDPKLKRRKRVILTGDVPSPIKPPPGCHFHTRCPYAMQACRNEAPELREVQPDHWVSCHLHENGPLFPLRAPSSA